MKGANPYLSVPKTLSDFESTKTLRFLGARQTGCTVTQRSKKGSEKVLGRVLGKGSWKGACCGFCSSQKGSQKGF